MLRKLAVVMTVLLLEVSVAAAQANRTVVWQRWDVLINNIDTATNQFTVTEIYDLQFTGTFHYGSAVIPFDRVTNITDVQVSEDGQLLHQYCSEQAGTFCTDITTDGFLITYYFMHLITDTTEHFEISYTVDGALRIYSGGDQLWWVAVPSDHSGFPIISSTITVILPPGYAPREGIDPIVTYGAPSEVQVNGSTVIAHATGEIRNDEAFEIRVQYPHDSKAQPPPWQVSLDHPQLSQEDVLSLDHIRLIVGLLLIFLASKFFVLTR
jgi:hypothetical protein